MKPVEQLVRTRSTRPALAARTGCAEAAPVRAALRSYLEENRVSRLERDPLMDLVGLVDEPARPRDVAEEHDHYLYGAPRTAS